MNSSNYIFLDIDGVLNSNVGWEKIEQFEQEHGGYTKDSLPEINHLMFGENDGNLGSWVETRLIENLQLLVKMCNAKVIGVSSWFTSRHDMEQVSEFLGIEISDLSYYTGGGLERGRGVEKYVNDHGIKKFVILDDSHEQMYEGKLLEEHLIRVDGREGFSFEHAMLAAGRLLFSDVVWE